MHRSRIVQTDRPHVQAPQNRLASWFKVNPKRRCPSIPDLDRSPTGAQAWVLHPRPRQLPPFLNNGVFHYKMRWNASIPNEFGQFGSHYLLVDPSHPDVQSFFTRQPTIIIDREGILGVCSTSSPSSLNIKPALRQSINRYWRLASPLEAHQNNLSFSPTQKINSGWFIEEPWE